MSGMDGTILRTSRSSGSAKDESELSYLPTWALVQHELCRPGGNGAGVESHRGDPTYPKAGFRRFSANDDCFLGGGFFASSASNFAIVDSQRSGPFFSVS